MVKTMCRCENCNSVINEFEYDTNNGLCNFCDYYKNNNHKLENQIEFIRKQQK